VRDNIDVGAVGSLVPSIPSDIIPTAIPSLGIGVPPMLNDNCSATGNDISNTSASPQLVGPSGYCYGTLGSPDADSADWYKITVNDQQRFTIVVSGDGFLDPGVEVFRPGETAAVTTSGNFGATPETIPLVADKYGEWRIRIYKQGGTAGNYFFGFDARDLVAVPSVSIPGVSVPPINVGLTDDCNTTGDAPGNKTRKERTQSARPLPNPAACTASLGLSSSADDVDWYSFRATKGQSVNIVIGGEGNLDPSIALFRPNGVKELSYPMKGPVPDFIVRDITMDGDWKLQVTKAVGSGAGHYGIWVDIPTGQTSLGTIPSSIPSVGATIPTLSGDCGQNGDAPGNKSRKEKVQQAREIPATYACAGSLGTGADVDDWYAFQGDSHSGQYLSLLQASETKLDADVYLYEPSGKLVASAAYGGLTPSYIPRYYFDKPGIWKLRIHRASGAGQYLLSQYLGS
jgi:hypothetical protein